ncbi:MAG: hypothetical protein D6747_05360 [Chlorobiota bacterium]|nr:MAG: hypothetical protein D6747_05360 [Chlorobiota bacterium]
MNAPRALILRFAQAAAVVSVAVGIFSGVLLALVYEPSSQSSTVRLYRAVSDVVDTSGDILLRRGDVAAVEQIPEHRGMLNALSDTAEAPVSVAARSHGLLASSVTGAIVLRVHALAASALILGLGAVWATMVLGGVSLRKHGIVIGMIALTMMLAWVGTTLSGTSRALDAYQIGRTLIVDNLPVVGDLAAVFLPERWNASRQFALHALWLTPMLGVLGGVVARRWRWMVGGVECGIVGLALVVGGVIWGMVDPPLPGGELRKPAWYLGAPYALFHVLPADATMLVVVFWWGVMVVASRSRSAFLRKTAVGMLGVWLSAGAVASLLLGER